MELLIFAGFLAAAAGLAGTLHCLVRALRIRRKGAAEADLRRQLQRLIPINYASLSLAAAGLILVALGMILRS